MVYIGAESFNIYKSNYDSRINEPIIECDELLAFPVQILNKKGYRVECCCSGHLVDTHFVDKSPNIDYDRKFNNDECFIQFENSMEELKEMGMTHIYDFYVPDNRILDMVREFEFKDNEDGKAIIKRKFDGTKLRFYEMIDCAKILCAWAGWQKPAKRKESKL